MSSFNMAACLSESGSYVPCQVDSYIVVKKKLVVTFKIIKEKKNQIKWNHIYELVSYKVSLNMKENWQLPFCSKWQ